MFPRCSVHTPTIRVELNTRALVANSYACKLYICIRWNICRCTYTYIKIKWRVYVYSQKKIISTWVGHYYYYFLILKNTNIYIIESEISKWKRRYGSAPISPRGFQYRHCLTQKGVVITNIGFKPVRIIGAAPARAQQARWWSLLHGRVCVVKCEAAGRVGKYIHIFHGV